MSSKSVTFYLRTKSMMPFQLENCRSAVNTRSILYYLKLHGLVLAPRLSTAFRKPFLLSYKFLQVPTEFCQLYFLLPTELSSVSPGPPIYELFSIRQIVRISLNSLINFRVDFLFIPIHFCMAETGYFRIQVTNTRKRINQEYALLRIKMLTCMFSVISATTSEDKFCFSFQIY